VLQNFCACTDFHHILIRFSTLIWSFCVMSVNTIYEVMLHMGSNTKTCTPTHTHTYPYINEFEEEMCIYPWGYFNYQPMDMNIGQMYGKLQFIENVQWHSCIISCIFHVSKACKIWQDEEIQHFQTKHMWINYTKWLLDNNILIDLTSLTSYHMFNLV
jgi:hypothetical protein